MARDSDKPPRGVRHRGGAKPGSSPSARKGTQARAPSAVLPREVNQARSGHSAELARDSGSPTARGISVSEAAPKDGEFDAARMTDVIEPKHDVVVMALISGKTIVEAAALAGVGESTVRKWLKFNRAVRAQYSSLREQAYQVAVGSWASSAGEFFGTLEEISSDKEQPGSTRVSAAKAGLDLILKVRELDLESQIRELEELIKGEP